MTPPRRLETRLRGLLAPTLKAMPAAAAACVRAHLDRDGADLGPARTALAQLLPDGDPALLDDEGLSLARGITLLAVAEHALAMVRERPSNAPTPSDVQAILAGDVSLAFGYRALGGLPDALHRAVLEAFAQSARIRLGASRGAAERDAAPTDAPSAASAEDAFLRLSVLIIARVDGRAGDTSAPRGAADLARVVGSSRHAGAGGR